MSTEAKVANKLQIKKESDSSKIKEGLDKHGELIAAISSGAIILTTWLLTNVLPHSVWVTLHIVAFFIGGYAQAKEGIIDTIEEKELNEIGRASCRERVYCSVIGTLMEEKEC